MSERLLELAGREIERLAARVRDLETDRADMAIKAARLADRAPLSVSAELFWRVQKERDALKTEVGRLHKCLDDAREGYEDFVVKINADVKAKAEAKTDVNIFTDLEKRVAALEVELKDERRLKNTFKNYWHEEAEKAERLAREVAALRQENVNLRGEMRTASREIDATTAFLRGHRIVTGPIVREHLGNLTDLARPELCDQPPCWCHDEARKLTAWPEGAASGPRRLHLGRPGLSGYFGCDSEACWCHTTAKE